MRRERWLGIGLLAVGASALIVECLMPWPSYLWVAAGVVLSVAGLVKLSDAGAADQPYDWSRDE